MPANLQNVPYHSFEGWIEAGYLWRPAHCRVQHCGLPIFEFYLPNDFPYRIDPETYGPHIDVCGDRRRVAAMHRAEDEKGRPPVDRKTAASGE